MPTLNELLKQAGVTIPDDVNVSELAEQSDEIKGLATTKNELHQWKLENKPVLESLQLKQSELEKKAKEKEEKVLKLAEENGDFKTKAEITAKRLEELESGLNASREQAKKNAHEAGIQSLASLFSDKLIAGDIAATKVHTELNEAGQPVTKFNLNGQSFDTVDEWKAEAAKIDSYAKHMPVGGHSNGPNQNGGGGDGLGGGQPIENKKAEECKAKGDLNGFLEASMFNK